MFQAGWADWLGVTRPFASARTFARVLCLSSQRAWTVWGEGRDAANPLRVAAVVSGGNPAPDQLEDLQIELSADGCSDGSHWRSRS